jgi:hypothetical protein
MAENDQQDEGRTRYAAYDTKLQRFIGGVQDSESKAKAAAKAMGVEPSDTQVRKV